MKRVCLLTRCAKFVVYDRGSTSLSKLTKRLASLGERWQSLFRIHRRDDPLDVKPTVETNDQRDQPKRQSGVGLPQRDVAGETA